MTKSVSPRDVEDVLSSIRRLVSEEAKARLGGEAAAQRLMLTEALRVPDPEEDAPEPEMREDGLRGDGSPEHAAPDAAAGHAAEDDPSAEAVTEPDRLDDWAGLWGFAGVSAAGEEARSPDTAPAATPPEAEPAAAPDALADWLAPFRDNAEGEAEAATAAPPEPEPEDKDAPQAGEAAVWSDMAEDAAAIAAPDEGEAAALAQALAGARPDIAPEPEAVLPDEAEPDALHADAGLSDEAGDDARSEDGAPDHAEEAPGDGPRGEGAGLFAADGEEGHVLDEETLRLMVADILRQELMGELGDRITRNVRKMVRREIQRALVARDFD